MDEYSWLKEVEAQPLSQITRDLNQAFNRTFKSGFGFPKFKSKKKSKNSYRTACGFKVHDSYCYIPKVGWLKMSEKLRFDGKINNITVSKTRTEKYFLTFNVDVQENISYPNVNKTIGIDMGLTDFCITSDGDKYSNNRFYSGLQKKLAKESRILSRRILRAKKENRKLSECKNVNKQRIKVAKIHEKIANQRYDFLHKLTSRLTDENQVICIEDLNVKEMLHDSELAKSISDVSWYEFARQLEYKSKWKARKLVKIDRYFPSSQICSSCGHNDGKKSLSIREWTCSNCETHHDRDINAAINIRTEGLSGIAW